MKVKLISNFIFNLGKGKKKVLPKGIYDSDEKPFPKELVEEIKKNRRVIQVMSGNLEDIKEMTTLDNTSQNIETKEKSSEKPALKRKKK